MAHQLPLRAPQTSHGIVKRRCSFSNNWLIWRQIHVKRRAAASELRPRPMWSVRVASRAASKQKPSRLGSRCRATCSYADTISEAHRASNFRKREGPHIEAASWGYSKNSAAGMSHWGMKLDATGGVTSGDLEGTGARLSCNDTIDISVFGIASGYNTREG